MKRRLPVPRAERLLNLCITLVCTAGLGLIVRLGPVGVRTAWHTPLVLGAFSALRGVCLCGLVDQVLFSGQGRGMSRWARMIRWVGVSRSRTGPVAV